ncbi:hypothetical protein BC829DRAFT_383788, partial [Chytridium lagenaria]
MTPIPTPRSKKRKRGLTDDQPDTRNLHNPISPTTTFTTLITPLLSLMSFINIPSSITVDVTHALSPHHYTTTKALLDDCFSPSKITATPTKAATTVYSVLRIGWRDTLCEVVRVCRCEDGGVDEEARMVICRMAGMDVFVVYGVEGSGEEVKGREETVGEVEVEVSWGAAGMMGWQTGKYGRTEPLHSEMEVRISLFFLYLSVSHVIMLFPM